MKYLAFESADNGPTQFIPVERFTFRHVRVKGVTLLSPVESSPFSFEYEVKTSTFLHFMGMHGNCTLRFPYSGAPYVWADLEDPTPSDEENDL